jgi:hypothetical protein
MSRRSVSEYCGFLELVWRIESVSVVDVADIEFERRDGTPRPELSKSFAIVDDEQIVRTNLFERAKPVSAPARQEHRREWQRARAENAALRVLTPEGLESAGIDHFDNAILSCVAGDWQSCERIIRSSYATLSDGLCLQISSDTLLFDRLLNLIDNEVIEGKKDGERWSMRESWVRLAPRGSAKRG